MSPLSAAVRRILVVACLVAGLVATLATAATAQVGDTGDVDDAAVKVDILPVDGFIDPPVANAIRDVVTGADERGSDLVVIQIDAPGGVSVPADELVATIRDATTPVVVFVGPRGARADALGAGALLLAAADVRVVAEDATVGPADPIDLAGDVDAEIVSELWPEGAAVLDAAQTADELADAGAVDLVASDLASLLVDLDGIEAGGTTLAIPDSDVGVRFHSLGLVRRMLHAATTPVFIYLLFTIGLTMLLFEVFQPGFGVAGIAGLITAGIGVFGLTVLPVTWWALALVVLGLLLYALDTAIAGFGPVTVAATAAFAVGSWKLYAAESLGLPVLLVVLTTIAALVFFVFIMTMVLRAQAGPDDLAVDDLVGRPGTVRSVLNPEGHVYIDGALWRARWIGDAKRAKVGTPVRVTGVDGAVVLVDAFDPQGASERPAATPGAHSS
jgi:membrane-bound serine protease (ClpP class)